MGLRKSRGEVSERDGFHFGFCLARGDPGDAQFDALHVLPSASLRSDNHKNLVIPERYVYSRSLGIKSLTSLPANAECVVDLPRPLQVTRASVMPDLRRPAQPARWFGARAGEGGENGIDEEGGQHAAQGHDHVVVA